MMTKSVLPPAPCASSEVVNPKAAVVPIIAVVHIREVDVGGLNEVIQLLVCERSAREVSKLELQHIVRIVARAGPLHALRQPIALHRAPVAHPAVVRGHGVVVHVAPGLVEGLNALEKPAGAQQPLDGGVQDPERGVGGRRGGVHLAHVARVGHRLQDLQEHLVFLGGALLAADVVPAAVRQVKVLAVGVEVLQHAGLHQRLVGGQACLLQHLQWGGALAGLARRAGRGAAGKARAPENLEDQGQRVAKAAVVVDKGQRLLVQVPLPADLDVQGAVRFPVQQHVHGRHVIDVEGALVGTALHTAERRRAKDILTPGQVGGRVCTPRCAKKAIRVDNIEPVSDFWHLQVGKSALVHNVVWVITGEWAEPFL
mmetsp:Transcript_22866/g.38282  ORF Transcript_22866/g.38282 Transcript_22866/m.38282 type:complete len:370 (-) Transcript_22866:365-1474(-)